MGSPGRMGPGPGRRELLFSQERLCLPRAVRLGWPEPGSGGRAGAAGLHPIAIAARDPQDEQGEQRPGAQ